MARRSENDIRRRPLIWVLCLVLVSWLAIAGCKADSDGQGSGDPTLDCESIAAASASAPALARIALTGLSGADQADDFVRVEVDGHAPYPTALYGAEAGEYEVLVPLHPDGAGGGPLDLVVTDGIFSCPAISFEVAPIPAPSGDPIRELAAAMAAASDAFADHYDVEPADLLETPLDELPPELVPLAILFETLAAIELEPELAALDADELETLQGLLGVIGLAEKLDELAGLIESLPPTLPPPPSAALNLGAAAIAAPDLRGLSPYEIALLPRQEAASAMAPQAAQGSVCGDLGAVEASRFDVSTPEDLAEYMRVARGAADDIGPLRDLISDYNGGLVALGLVPGGGAATAAVRALWGWGRYGAELIYQMRASLYPSAITRVTFEVNESEIPEDWDTSIDGKVEWSLAKLYATNDGMQIAHVVDILPSITTSPGAAGFYGASERSGVPGVDPLGNAEVNERLEELQDEPELRECWSIPPTEFGPAIVPDDTGSQWVSASVIEGASITVADREITPVATGSSTLRVETNTAELPGPRGFGDRIIAVLTKQVSWNPIVLRVEETGQEEMVQVRFIDTRHYEPEKVVFDPDAGITGLDPVSLGGGFYNVYFTTPTERGNYPLEIVARSTSNQLPPDMSPREGKIVIGTDDQVTISPRDGCVPYGDSFDLEATVSSATGEASVDWEVVSGAYDELLSFGEAGLEATYFAPSSGSGRVTIRASLSEDSDVKDEVTLSHGNCVDIAVFYKFAGQIVLPGVSPGCESIEAGPIFLYENDDEDGNGIDPESPLTPGEKWGPGQSFSIDEPHSSSGARGLGVSADDCQGGQFPASMRNQSTVRVTDTGDTVLIDVDNEGSAECSEWSGDGGTACSSAQTTSFAWTTWEFNITEAGSYRAKVDLVCASVPAIAFELGNIVLGFQRYTEAGEAVLTHREFSKAVLVKTDRCTNGGGPVAIDVPFEVDAPLAEGTTDRLIIYLSAVVGAFASPEGIGSYEARATMTGEASVKKVGE